MKGTVYVMNCKVTGMNYVGATLSKPEERWRQECWPSAKTTKLSAAIKKHGKDSFTQTILTVFECECGTQCECGMQERLWLEEDRWIGILNAIEAGYNNRKGGRRGPQSAETKAKLREKSKYNAETRTLKKLASL